MRISVRSSVLAAAVLYLSPTGEGYGQQRSPTKEGVRLVAQAEASSSRTTRSTAMCPPPRLAPWSASRTAPA